MNAYPEQTSKPTPGASASTATAAAWRRPRLRLECPLASTTAAGDGQQWVDYGDFDSLEDMGLTYAQVKTAGDVACAKVKVTSLGKPATKPFAKQLGSAAS